MEKCYCGLLMVAYMDSFLIIWLTSDGISHSYEQACNKGSNILFVDISLALYLQTNNMLPFMFHVCFYDLSSFTCELYMWQIFETFNWFFQPLKVVFCGDNVPKDRADKAMEAAKGCDAFLVLGSSLMTMSAFRLVR